MKKWQALAERKLNKILKIAQTHAALRRLAPSGEWRADVQIVGDRQMKEMNSSYRGKDYATDVLSFPAPAVFRQQGVLGETIICFNTLKRQAREMKHSSEQELEVLLVHSVLHLLGIDHELGPAQARRMAAWERKLLSAKNPTGLIDRVKSGIHRA